MPRLLSVVALLACAVLGVSAQRSAPAPAQAPIRISYLYSDGNISGTLKAFKALLQERPDLRNRVALSFITESMLPDVKLEDVTKSNILVLDVMNQQMLERVNKEKNVDLIAAVRRQGKVLAVGEGLLPKEHYTKQGALWDPRARTYWAHMGAANQVALLKYALTQAGVTGLSIPDPQPSMDFGYYYPAVDRPGAPRAAGQVFQTWEQFTAWRQKNGKLRPGAPRIAIGFYKAAYYGDETELIDAVIANIERRGAEAIPIFGYPGDVATARLLVDASGKSRADAMLGFFFNFAGPDSSGYLARVDIPIINLISLYGRSESEWRSSPMGLSFFEGTFNVAVPELAGTIAPTVVGSQEKLRDPDTGMTVVVRRPILPQISMAVGR
ncbi:MAG TPA: cobaltochelatase subunit CobN, partial [Vicinamibacterales bacterium]|nr:cobaltochelatase subunit CobN [Vicinamibacterales bacterium]